MLGMLGCAMARFNETVPYAVPPRLDPRLCTIMMMSNLKTKLGQPIDDMPILASLQGSCL